jgi:hypothetical protein
MAFASVLTRKSPAAARGFSVVEKAVIWQVVDRYRTVIEGVRGPGRDGWDMGPETVSKHFCTEGNACTQAPSVPVDCAQAVRSRTHHELCKPSVTGPGIG